MPVAIEELLLDERDGFFGRVSAFFRLGGIDLLKSSTRASQSPNRQPIPRHDDLIIKSRSRPVHLAVFSQLGSSGLENGDDFLFRQAEFFGEHAGGCLDAQDVLADEFVVGIVGAVDVTVGRDAVEAGTDVGVAVAEDGVEVFERPDIVGSFSLLGIGACGVGVCVFGGKEPACWGGDGGAREIGGDVVDGSEHFGVVGDEERVEIDTE